MNYPTEWLPDTQKRGSAVFLQRCVNESTAFVKDEGAKIRISFPSYKLVYEGGSEDVIWGKTDYTGLEEQAEKREQERKRSRWLVS